MQTRRVVCGVMTAMFLAGCSPKYDTKLDPTKDGYGKLTKKEVVDVEAALFEAGEKDSSKIRFGKFQLHKVEIDGKPFAVSYNHYDVFDKMNRGDEIYWSSFGKGVLVPNDLGAYDTYKMVTVSIFKKRPRFELNVKELREKGKTELKEVK